MTLLQAITKLYNRQSLTAPSTVYGSVDKGVIQARALLEEGLDAMVGRGLWQQLVREATHVTLAQEDQGAITSIAPNYKWMIPTSLFNRTTKLPLVGPLDASQWQYLKAVAVTGPRYSFYVRGGRFLVTPAPTAGDTWAFEYAMDCWGETTAGSGSYIKAFTADANNILLPDEVVLADLRWRWKREKGLSYAQDFDNFELLLKDSIGRNGPHPILHMDEHIEDARPGIGVQPYSWPLP
jgi:hypothetical protein